MSISQSQWRIFMKLRTGMIFFSILLLSGMSLSFSDLDLEIQVSPQKLVLSSSGGQFTIHTDTPFLSSGNWAVVLVDGIEVDMHLFSDLCGNLVAQCSRDKVKDVIPYFEGKTKIILIEMMANGKQGLQEITVKK